MFSYRFSAIFTTLMNVLFTERNLRYQESQFRRDYYNRNDESVQGFRAWAVATQTSTDQALIYWV